MLTNHIWSYADASGGSRKPDVNATFIQPFLSYTWKDSTTLTLNSESTYDWSADQWNVPINLVVSHVYNFGQQPVQFAVGGRVYADSPEGGPLGSTRRRDLPVSHGRLMFGRYRRGGGSIGPVDVRFGSLQGSPKCRSRRSGRACRASGSISGQATGWRGIAKVLLGYCQELLPRERRFELYELNDHLPCLP